MNYPKCCLQIIFFCLAILGCKNSKQLSTIHVEARGNGRTDCSNILQAAINKSNGTVVLKKGIYFITKTISLKSNISIEGNGATIVTPKNQNFHCFLIQNVKNIKLRNLEYSGNKKNQTLNKNNINYYPLFLSSADNITIQNVNFRNTSTTCIEIEDGSDITISNCSFESIGKSTAQLGPSLGYAYSGIFIGGYQKSNNIFISECRFINIGIPRKNSLDYKNLNLTTNDGNGIQILMLENGISSNINIEKCTFTNCARRGIKVQTGNEINILNNKFENCKCAIGFTMSQPLSHIDVKNNQFANCTYALATNGNYSMVVTDLSVSKNEANNIYGFLRTFGNSSVSHGRISTNLIRNTFLSVIDGRFKNSSFEENKFLNFGLLKDESYYMSMLFSEGSQNITISANEVQSSTKTNCAIYFQNNVKNTTVKNNTFTIPNFGKTEQFLIHFSDKSITQNGNKLQNNKINGRTVKNIE